VVSETRTPYVVADPDALCTEAEFQQSLTDLADVLGLPWLHVRDSRRQHVTDWPDLHIADPAHGTLYAWELKSMRGRVTNGQRRLGEALSRCYRLEYGVYRPCDFQFLQTKLLGSED
jgi:hypothetical protein